MSYQKERPDKEHAYHQQEADERKLWWKSKLVLAGFLMVIGYFLWTEHQAHVIEFLPYSLLGICILMHFFMHHGHGSHHDSSAEKKHTRKDD